MTSDILQRIVGQKQKRLEQVQARVPLPTLRAQIDKITTCAKKTWTIASDSFGLIAEVKKASPSLGMIPWQLTMEELVSAYEQGGAAAISVLTEEDFFRGCIEDLRRISKLSPLPVLRKDFIWTEYQLLESKLAGADAVLLIVALMDAARLKFLLQLCHQLELQALVECRDAQEIQTALAAGARILGINNRNLRTFEVDLETTLRLLEQIPEDKVVVSESGFHTTANVERVARAGVNAILVGEAFVKHSDPCSLVQSFVQAGKTHFAARRGCQCECESEREV